MGNVLSANFAPECDIPKKAYDDCFNKWYSEKFLQAKSVTNECEDTWREYEDCLYLALDKKGIKTRMTKDDPVLDKYLKEAKNSESSEASASSSK